MLTTGYCKLDRGILKYFKKPYTENEAWIWMITQADYRNGCKYGKIEASTHQLAEIWGRNQSTVSRWLKKWANEKTPRISCRYSLCNAASLHNNLASELASGVASETTEITLLNYKEYQNPKPTQASGHASERATLLKNKKESTKKKNLPDSNESVVTPNSQVYNFFVQKKREGHNRPEWLPSANQAKQLRANISHLLKQYKPEELVLWVENFFADPKMIENGWPWKFFMVDPIRWAQKAKEAQFVSPSFRKFEE